MQIVPVPNAGLGAVPTAPDAPTEPVSEDAFAALVANGGGNISTTPEGGEDALVVLFGLDVETKGAASVSQRLDLATVAPPVDGAQDGALPPLAPGERLVLAPPQPAIPAAAETTPLRRQPDLNSMQQSLRETSAIAADGAPVRAEAPKQGQQPATVQLPATPQYVPLVRPVAIAQSRGAEMPNAAQDVRLLQRDAPVARLPIERGAADAKPLFDQPALPISKLQRLNAIEAPAKQAPAGQDAEFPRTAPARPAPKVAAQAPAASPSLPLGSSDRNNVSVEIAAPVDGTRTEPAPISSRASDAPGAPEPRMPAAEVARSIGRQIIESARVLPDRPVEVALSPEELGRVRMTIATGEAGLTVSIQTERGETLDLMRRHIEVLAQEFRDAGFEDVAFAFGERADAQEDAEAEEPTADGPSEASASAVPAPVGTAGLDIRL